MPVIRHLLFEAYALSASDLRSRLERRGDDQPRTLALAERNVRDQQQQARLPGVELIGDRECSRALIDLVAGMADKNQLEYIHWHQCTKRSQEISGIKQESYFATDASGVLKLMSKPQEHVAVVWALRWAARATGWRRYRRAVGHNTTDAAPSDKREQLGRVRSDVGERRDGPCAAERIGGRAASPAPCS